MLAAPFPPNEAERLAALQDFEILDTAVEESFDRITRLAAKLTDSPIALISLIDAKRQWFKSKFGLDLSETKREYSFCAHAILNPDQPLIVEDALKDSRFFDNPNVTDGPKFRFYAGVPLCNKDGFALGTLCIIDRKPRELDRDTLDSLESLAHIVMTTLELHWTTRLMTKMALTDALTGLPNRRAFIDLLDQDIARKKRARQPFALLFVDLDEFKRVNDLHGHPTGDRVLREAAGALRSSIRFEDTVARFSGDEFAVLLTGAVDEAETVGERIRCAIEEKMTGGGWAVTASVGVAVFRNPPTDAEEALAIADATMYMSKTAGRNRVFYREISSEEKTG